MERVAQRSKADCVKSPKAVSPVPRVANKDTRRCAQTTAHTIPVHLPGCFTEIQPSLRVYGRARESGHYGSNRGACFLADRGCESLNKPENIVIGVVERHRCHSEGIWLPPVAHNALLGKPFTQRPPVGADSDGKLRATPIFFARRHE